MPNAILLSVTRPGAARITADLAREMLPAPMLATPRAAPLPTWEGWRRAHRYSTPARVAGTLPFPGARPSRVGAGHTAPVAPLTRPGTVRNDLAARAAAIVAPWAPDTAVVTFRSGAGRGSAVSTLPGARVRGAMLASLATLSPDRAPIIPGPDNLLTVIRPVGALIAPLTVVTLSTDVVDPTRRAYVHRSTVRAIINRALNGSIMVGERLKSFTLPDPTGKSPVKVHRIFDGAFLVREHRAHVTPADIAEMLLDSATDAEDAADIRIAAAIASSKVASTLSREEAVIVAAKNIRQRGTQSVYRDRVKIRDLGAKALLSGALSPVDAKALAAAMARLDEEGLAHAMPGRGKSSPAVTAPTDGPMSRGENLIRPGTRDTGRYVPMPGR